MLRNSKKILIIIPVLLAISLSIYLIFFSGDKIERPRNIIIMLFDAVRADRLSAYGFEKKTTPFLDRLRSEGVVFENAYSQASSTLPSVASYFSGQYIDFHGAMTPRGYLKQEIITMAEVLQGNDYLTIGLINNPWINREKYFNQGFRFWRALHDDEITRYALSFLDIDNINPVTIRNRNLFKFDKPMTGLRKLKNPEYCLTGNGFALRPEEFQKTMIKEIQLCTTGGEIAESDYFWGASLRADSNLPVTLLVEGTDRSGISAVIEKKKIEITPEWSVQHFSLSLKEKQKSLKLILKIDQVEKGKGSIYIDDIFLMQKSENRRYRSKFFYMHYLSPHFPHEKPVKDQMIEIFERGDYTGSVIDINGGLTDPLGLNNGKYLFQTSLWYDWHKMSSNIDDHLKNYYYEISYSDQQIEKIVNYLKKTGQFEDTMLIIVSDHGEEFLDHGFLDHALTLYNETIHIPFFISYPSEFASGIKVRQNIATIDLFPTILDMVNVNKKIIDSLGKQVQGKSLVDFLRGGSSMEDRIIYSSDYFLAQRAAMYKNYKMISLDSGCYQKELLFDLEKDPGETGDIRPDNPEIYNKLSQSLKQFRETARQYKITEAETISRNKNLTQALAKLGYLGMVEMSEQYSGDMHCVMTQQIKNIIFLFRMRFACNW